MERRFLSVARCPVSLETRVGTDPPLIVGYAAVFYAADDAGTQYQLDDYGQGMVERVMPWAFADALKSDDCRALVNHDPNLLLGRSGAGTLKLSTDKTGLRYAITPPDTQAGRDCRESIARGDMTGSSFSFQVTKQKWIEQKGGPTVREIHACRLYDVGPVTFPAYASTTAGMRALGDQDELRQAYEDHRLVQKKDQALRDQVAARGRIVELGL